MRPIFWTPDKVAMLKALTAEKLNDRQIALRMDISWKAVNARRILMGIPAQPRAKMRIVPDDFLAVAPTMSIERLAQHYKAAVKTINRWLTESGAKAGRRVYTRIHQIRPKSKLPQMNTWGAPKPPPLPLPDCSLAGQAAQYLRRYYVPVCRLKTIQAKAPDDVWIVGRLNVSTESMIEMAGRKGFAMGLAA